MTEREQHSHRIDLEWKYPLQELLFLTIDRPNPERQDLRPNPSLQKWTDTPQK